MLIRGSAVQKENGVDEININASLNLEMSAHLGGLIWEL